MVEYFARDIVADGVKDLVLHRYHHTSRRNRITTPPNITADLILVIQELNQFRDFLFIMKSESAKIYRDLQNGCHVDACNEQVKNASAASVVTDVNSFDNLGAFYFLPFVFFAV